MSNADQKAIISRLVEEFWNQRNDGVFDEVVAVNFVDHSALPGSPQGRDAKKQEMLHFRNAFSNASTTLDDAVSDGDKVAWRWTFQGTHTGELMGIPATGKTIALSGITIDRIVNNQITERWNQMDVMGMMQQLGVMGG
jgi:steroid delta-isomerase-like uncharacterized protein